MDVGDNSNEKAVGSRRLVLVWKYDISKPVSSTQVSCSARENRGVFCLTYCAPHL